MLHLVFDFLCDLGNFITWVNFTLQERDREDVLSYLALDLKELWDVEVARKQEHNDAVNDHPVVEQSLRVEVFIGQANLCIEDEADDNCRNDNLKCCKDRLPSSSEDAINVWLTSSQSFLAPEEWNAVGGDMHAHEHPEDNHIDLNLMLSWGDVGFQDKSEHVQANDLELPYRLTVVNNARILHHV